MSYWNVPDADYHELAVATPGWQNAPVPGWGINPLRAGPMRVGIGGLGQSIPGEDDFLPHWAALGADPEATYKETSWGVVAGGVALGIGLGLLFGYAWWGQKKLTPNKRHQRGREAPRKPGDDWHRQRRGRRKSRKGERRLGKRGIAEYEYYVPGEGYEENMHRSPAEYMAWESHQHKHRPRSPSDYTSAYEKHQSRLAAGERYRLKLKAQHESRARGR
jgi:hypothetical protein